MCINKPSERNKNMELFDLKSIMISGTDRSICLKLSCTNEDRLFFNGFQSWSTSVELSPSDIDKGASAFIRTIGKPWGTQHYGDGYFMDYSDKPGIFHGFSYFYKRSGDEFLLIGSVDETNGYTIFNYDAGVGELSIVKDAGFGRNAPDKSLHLFSATGTETEVFDAWFSEMGVSALAKPIAGYSSWYNHYENINDASITEDLDGATRVLKPGDLFQIDDGWEAAVGDWTEDAAKFPRGMKASVSDIHERGYLAGLWLAPFVACSRSKLWKEHRDWFLLHNGKPWYCGCNWGGFFSLDMDKPEVQDYLKATFDKVLNDWGFDLVKLDFLYGAAPWMTRGGSYDGESRGARMCRAMDMLRGWCGDKLILGCGVPLWPAFGKVDYCRIGCDAGLDWENTWLMRQVNREVVSTKNSIGNSYYRRELSGRAFLNDPDVFFLRDDNIKLT